MSSYNALIKNTAIYSLGNFGSKFLAFFVVPLYSFYLSKSELGHYDLILTTLSLLIPIITLQISEAAYRWLLDAKKDTTKQTMVVSTSSFFVLISLAISLLILSICTIYYSFNYYVYFFVLIPLACINPYLQQIARGLGDNYGFSISGIINAILLFSSSISILQYTQLGLKGLIYSLMISLSGSIIFLIYRVKLSKLLDTKRIKKESMLSMLQYSWPLIPNAISWWLINASNRFVILYFLGVNYNGIFAISNRFPAIILIINSIFMMAWQDHVLSEDKTEKSTDFESSFNKFICFELSLTLILISVSRILIKYTIDEKFYEAWKYMPLLYVGVAVSSLCSFLGTKFIKKKLTKSIFYSTILGGLINIIFSFLFTPKLGLYAPTIGTFLGFTAVLITRLFELNKIIPIKANGRIIIFCLLSIPIYISTSMLENTIVDLMMLIVSIIISVLLNREVIGMVLSTFRNSINNKFYPRKEKLKIYGK